MDKSWNHQPAFTDSNTVTCTGTPTAAFEERDYIKVRPLEADPVIMMLVRNMTCEELMILMETPLTGTCPTERQYDLKCPKVADILEPEGRKCVFQSKCPQLTRCTFQMLYWNKEGQVCEIAMPYSRSN